MSLICLIRSIRKADPGNSTAIAREVAGRPLNINLGLTKQKAPREGVARRQAVASYPRSWGVAGCEEIVCSSLTAPKRVVEGAAW